MTPGTHVFDVTASFTAYTGAVLALRVDDVLMPGGRAARREVVEHLGAVAVVALDEQGRVALIQQYRHPLGRRLWELPAGLLDVPGEPPVRAAARELGEEAGLAARDWAVLVDVAASPGFTDESVRVFLATGLRAVDRPAAEGNEEDDLVVHRVPLIEAVELAMAGEVVNASAVAGLLAAERVVSGRSRPRAVDAGWRDRPTRLAGRSG